MVVGMMAKKRFVIAMAVAAMTATTTVPALAQEAEEAAPALAPVAGSGQYAPDEAATQQEAAQAQEAFAGVGVVENLGDGYGLRLGASEGVRLEGDFDFAAFEGETVRVSGRFAIDETRARVLQVESIEPAAEEGEDCTLTTYPEQLCPPQAGGAGSGGATTPGEANAVPSQDAPAEGAARGGQYGDAASPAQQEEEEDAATDVNEDGAVDETDGSGEGSGASGTGRRRRRGGERRHHQRQGRQLLRGRLGHRLLRSVGPPRHGRRPSGSGSGGRSAHRRWPGRPQDLPLASLERESGGPVLKNRAPFVVPSPGPQLRRFGRPASSLAAAQNQSSRKSSGIPRIVYQYPKVPPILVRKNAEKRLFCSRFVPFAVLLRRRRRAR